MLSVVALIAFGLISGGQALGDTSSAATAQSETLQKCAPPAVKPNGYELSRNLVKSDVEEKYLAPVTSGDKLADENGVLDAYNKWFQSDDETFRKNQCEKARSYECPLNAPAFFRAMPDLCVGALEQDEVLTLMRRVGDDVAAEVIRLKKGEGRPRPYLTLTTFDPAKSSEGTHRCLHRYEEKPDASWPSLHAAMSRAQARVMALLFPDLKDALLARADEVATSRLVLGVHHPRDVQAGQEIADRVVELLMKGKACDRKTARPESIPDPVTGPCFRADLAAAQSAVRKSCGLGGSNPSGEQGIKNQPYIR